MPDVLIGHKGLSPEDEKRARLELAGEILKRSLAKGKPYNETVCASIIATVRLSDKSSIDPYDGVYELLMAWFSIIVNQQVLAKN